MTYNVFGGTLSLTQLGFVRTTYFQLECLPSVLSLRQIRKSRLNGSRYRNMLCTTLWNDARCFFEVKFLNSVVHTERVC